MAKLAGGQLELINGQRRLDRAIAAEQDPERRALLQAVPDAKRFAQEVLALPTGKSYTGYFATEREGMTYVLTASERTRLHAYAWWFPIVGTVEYRSYYDKREAEAAAAELEARDYDTWVSPSRAYSTLGFFRDPVTTTMMRDGLPSFVDVLFHELAHVRLYVPGHTEWNEALATFVGETGAEQYFARARFANSAWPAQMRKRAAQKHELDILIVGACDGLERLYASGQSRASIEQERTRVFAALERATRRLRPEADPRDWKMNNARLVHFRRYSAGSAQVVQLWQRSGRHWRTFWKLAEAYARSEL